jgi:hypothetical protein
MVQLLNFWRLLAAFTVGTVVNLSWQDQVGQQMNGTALLGWAGLGSNLGFFSFGLGLVALSRLGYHLPAAKWPLSLAGLLAIYFIGSPLAFYVDSTAAIVMNSAGLTLFHTAFFAQLTAVAIDGSDFRLTRRGGTIGYGIAFLVASCRWPELSCSLVLVATLGLLGLRWVGGRRAIPYPPIAATSSTEPAPAVPTQNWWWQFVPVLVLFSTLGACARVYDSFGPPSLLGTTVGLFAIGTLLFIEVIILPLTQRIPGRFWIIAAVFGWAAAYGTLWLGPPWLILGVSLISINCCGQVVLQQRTQALAQRGTANLQAVLYIGSASAAGVVSTLAVSWSRGGEASVWALGLLTTSVALLIVGLTILVQDVIDAPRWWRPSALPHHPTPHES